LRSDLGSDLISPGVITAPPPASFLPSFRHSCESRNPKIRLIACSVDKKEHQVTEASVMWMAFSITTFGFWVPAFAGMTEVVQE